MNLVLSKRIKIHNLWIRVQKIFIHYALIMLSMNKWNWNAKLTDMTHLEKVKLKSDEGLMMLINTMMS